MPRVAKAKAETKVEATETKATEKPVESNENPVVENSEFEVKDHMKANGSILVGTQFIPIVNGKVKVGAKLKEVLEKSGFLK